MKKIKTEAWILERNNKPGKEFAKLRKGVFSFPMIEPDEVLVEPIYGCWEGNMNHALERDPIDICIRRGEREVVLGNAGVIRVLEIGSEVNTVEVGDFCVLAPIGSVNKFGNMVQAFGYDARNTVGLLAKQTKVKAFQLAVIPKDTKHSLIQWAAFSLRYSTAWVNWNKAYSVYRLGVNEDENPQPRVWGWGGGVTFAELCLAKSFGCKVAMITSKDERKKIIEKAGITAIDRREFPNLNYNDEQYRTDRSYKINYLRAERAFLDIVKLHTDEEKVSIFIDNIGRPVFRATKRALAVNGVIATAGWKEGMNLSLNRAEECINHHTYVYTHGARYKQGIRAMVYGEETGWMPPEEESIYEWDDIPDLAVAFHRNEITSYFPIYRIN